MRITDPILTKYVSNVGREYSYVKIILICKNTLTPLTALTKIQEWGAIRSRQSTQKYQLRSKTMHKQNSQMVKMFHTVRYSQGCEVSFRKAGVL